MTQQYHVTGPLEDDELDPRQVISMGQFSIGKVTDLCLNPFTVIWNNSQH